MKITINREDLLKPLSLIGGVVERRQTLPILANVLINARADRLGITATDLEVELRTHAPASVEGEADFTVPARKLLDICKALPEGAELQLALDGDKATLRSGRGRYTLGTLPATEYPGIESSAATEILEIPEKVLKRLIDKTQFAMAQQDVRYYLNGMLLEFTPGRIRAVATDGHRLALCDEVFAGKTRDLNVQIIVPRKAVGELRRMLTERDDMAKAEVSSSHLSIHLKEASFTTKLIDGRYPDYQRVIPSGEPSMVVADRVSLQQALARTSILSNEKYRGIRFRLGEDLLHLQAHNPEQEEAEEEVELQYRGEPVTIGFNVGYLLDVLNVIDDDQVQIAVTDANSSALITPLGADSPRYVVMPMRL
ncbi:MAG: DNA polymerase III subunit beta [Gammaproteobacteria bacterium]|jgi:DNA polymerase-3 subunit beta